MRKVDTLRRRALCTASFMGLAIAIATPAYAQDQNIGANQPPTCDPNDPTDSDCNPGPSEVEIESGTNLQNQQQGPDITVTGSRIRRPNVESNVPVTSVNADDLVAQGNVTVGDALNDLPALRSTFSQANSTRFIGTTGLNLLDLRGLGNSRTLVLVNGRRHITASPGDFLVDVNTIPSDLIERVDVVTGGSSAVYGSDAVAGVVNFITRRDFEGIRLTGEASISGEGDRGIQSVSLTAGHNFFDDRLNIAGNLEYVHADPLYFTERDSQTGAFSGRCQFNTAENTIDDGPTGSDGIPDQQFFCGVRNATISNGGTVTAPIAASTCQNPAISAANRGLCINPGTPLGQPRIFRFDASGNLVEEVPGLDFRNFGSGNVLGGGGATLRDTGQIAPGLDRYTANLLMRFDVSPAFQPFLEAKYVYLESLQEGQPSFFQSSFPAFFGFGRGIRCDNPFLTTQNIAALQAIGRCAGGATSTETIPLARFNIDFGGRREFFTRETYRIVAGVGGEFNGDWNYEISFNYGHFDGDGEEENDLQIFNIDANGVIVDQGPFLQAIDVIRDANGNIVCRDPAARAAGCVPINVFGFGRPSPEALDFVNTTSFTFSDASETNILAFINGDSSQVFELPGGPVRFVIGAEYRREEAFSNADPLSAAGATFFNAFQVFDPPPLEVIEGFGELEIPILRDVPFAQELTLTGAARYSDYNTSADTTFAWNANLTWAPIRDLRFRGNYSRSVRVPTLGDLFTPDTQNFAFLADPCDVLNINNGSPNRVANCQAAGVPAGFVNQPARSQTTEIISSGNPFLEEEKSDSYTLGFVYTPSYIPGLSFTADYYDITVNNLIAVLGGQTILNQCFDLPQPNQFCSLIFPRNPDSTFASPALRSAGVNFAKLEAQGIDFELAYRRRFDNGMRLDIRSILTYVIERNNFTDPINPEFGSAQVLAFGDPQLAANFTVVVGKGPFDLRYSVNYVGEMLIGGGIETYFGFQGRPASNPDLTAEVFYPDYFNHRVRFSWQASEKFQFYFGINNLFDTLPPFGQVGNEGGSPYDAIGRTFYAGARIDF